MFHIVTLFPELLNYSFYAPLLLRIVLAIFAFSFGFSIKNNWIRDAEKNPEENIVVSEASDQPKKEIHYLIKALFIFAGVLILAGFYTQIAAMILTLLFVISLFKQEWIMTNKIGRAELILLIAISLAMIILPAGYFAIDYPL